MARDIYEDQDGAEAPKDGLSNGLIYLTFIVLVAAIFITQKALKDHYKAGMLADKAPALEGAGS
jgi:hypothetical protein